MTSILVVTGSVRPQSVNEKVVPLVITELELQGAQVKVANLQELNLPFFDDPHTPLSDAFKPTHPEVITWTQLVEAADGVVLVTPEYNHTMSPVQLNAVDWIGLQWAHKPVALVGYGWTSGASQAHATAREVLAANLKASVGDTQTNLFFGKHLNPDGSVADTQAVTEKIAATVRELLEATV